MALTFMDWQPGIHPLVWPQGGGLPVGGRIRPGRPVKVTRPSSLSKDWRQTYVTRPTSNLPVKTRGPTSTKVTRTGAVVTATRAVQPVRRVQPRVRVRRIDRPLQQLQPAASTRRPVRTMPGAGQRTRHLTRTQTRPKVATTVIGRAPTRYPITHDFAPYNPPTEQVVSRPVVGATSVQRTFGSAEWWVFNKGIRLG